MASRGGSSSSCRSQRGNYVRSPSTVSRVRNTFAAFGHEPPGRLTIPVDPETAGILEGLRTTRTHDHVVRTPPPNDLATPAAAPSGASSVWLPWAHPVQAGVILLGFCAGPLDEAEELLGSQADGAVRESLDRVYPGATLTVLTVVWDAWSLTRPRVLAHRRNRGPPLANRRFESGVVPRSDAGTERPLLVRSGLKYKRCSPTHHPDGVAF